MSGAVPLPGDWRDGWIYFLLLDRFNNPVPPPRGHWNRRFDFRQGGPSRACRRSSVIWTIWACGRLAVASAEELAAGLAVQLSRLRRPRLPERRRALCFRRQPATAERELAELIDEAHARGMYVILDIVLNHAARVFDYVRPDGVVAGFADPASWTAHSAASRVVAQWLRLPRADWQDRLTRRLSCIADDAVWPSDLQNHLFFRRRGRS